MNFLSPTRTPRLNEAVGILLLLVSLAMWLSLLSFSGGDPSWNTASGAAHTHNLLGLFGAKWSDFFLQIFGLAIFLLPIHIGVLGWKWIRSSDIESPWFRIFGSLALWFCVCTGCGLIPHPWLIGGSVRPSGLVGLVLADYLRSRFDLAGSAIITAASAVIALYFATTFEVSTLTRWFMTVFGVPIEKCRSTVARWRAARAVRHERAMEKARLKAAARSARRSAQPDAPSSSSERSRSASSTQSPGKPAAPVETSVVREFAHGKDSGPADDDTLPPFDMPAQPPARGPVFVAEIPIRTLADQPVVPADSFGDEAIRAAQGSQEHVSPEPPPARRSAPLREPVREHAKRKQIYRLPTTELLNDVAPGNGFDGQELKDVAGKIKSKLDEFNVRGSVVQINPGPVVTTFEFKPEAGVKYSRITTLSEDLCLGLQAESVLIERIPGKSTVGIEVPNSRREVISLRGILESAEFETAASKLTIALGKDINGRIKVAPLETMPHLLIAGSTGSGKSVMLNAMIMSFLFKATPDEVRMIMIDPKRVEMGIYEGIPHLLTPVITEPKKATYALRNAVLEMERRLKLLAAQGVRNIDQFNRKVAQLRQAPRGLFDDMEEENDELKPLPFVLIIIDELADLMMLERANVEECITRLAQMARAVGMHLVLATQRPSVDVITGLIKANFPSRISFRVATRVDSRTVLDSMGAEHLLGKGDMLFLPPGSSRLTRVHGAFVSESETNQVVEFWKSQAKPEYDESFLKAPPSDDDEDAAASDDLLDGEQDPMYEDAVRVVLEMGKASTSTLQRRLRLGYGRAARILDIMQRDGIIGPPDGSKPREVLKRPDWLNEVENQLR
jgi:S-DNA-T family DNA segregation ATPase FtsK/SpoIIIE